MMNNRVFTPVDYREFRHHMENISAGKVKEKGYETIIYDRKGDIQAILHSASIDGDGNCYPAEYFVRSQALDNPISLAA